jgi:hypothetical protein
VFYFSLLCILMMFFVKTEAVVSGCGVNFSYLFSLNLSDIKAIALISGAPMVDLLSIPSQSKSDGLPCRVLHNVEPLQMLSARMPSAGRHPQLAGCT